MAGRYIKRRQDGFIAMIFPKAIADNLISDFGNEHAVERRRPLLEVKCNGVLPARFLLRFDLENIVEFAKIDRRQIGRASTAD